MSDNFFDDINNIDFNLLSHIVNNIILEENDNNISSNDSDISSDENNSNDNDINSDDNNDEYDNLPDRMPVYGCKHYLRRCKIVSPCCNTIFACRLCHDEAVYDQEYDDDKKHKMNRFDIKSVVCTNCDKLQEVNEYCESCNICFGLYYCSICHFWDDIDKMQFHCEGCGFCRIGGKENFVHCDKCNMCIPIKNSSVHKCIEIRDSLCPICMVDLFTSTNEILQIKCGHYLHKTCLNELLSTSYKCPICSSSIIDTKEIDEIIQEEINLTPMPVDYNNTFVKILCNDCHNENDVKFHIIGLKCNNCGSFNTRKI